MKLHHGCDNPAVVLNAIAAERRGERGLKGDFYVAPKAVVAHNYGKYVIKFVMAADVAGADVGLINRNANFNRIVGNEVEVVMRDVNARADFANKVVEAEVVCPDGRVAHIDVDSGLIREVA